METTPNNIVKRYTEEIIFYLNVLGPIYHTGFGLNHLEDIIETDRLPLPIISFALDKDSHFHDILITEDGDESTEVVTIDPKNIESKQFFIEGLNPHLLELSKKRIFYDEVVIMYKTDTWFQKPNFLYNEQSRWWTAKKHANLLVEKLDSRKYIIVNDPFVKITISRKTKGLDISLDDILFATRALSLDDTRTIDGGYELIKFEIKDDLSVLYIEPQMDNFST